MKKIATAVLLLFLSGGPAPAAEPQGAEKSHPVLRRGHRTQTSRLLTFVLRRRQKLELTPEQIRDLEEIQREHEKDIHSRREKISAVRKALGAELEKIEPDFEAARRLAVEIGKLETEEARADVAHYRKAWLLLTPPQRAQIVLQRKGKKRE